MSPAMRRKRGLHQLHKCIRRRLPAAQAHLEKYGLMGSYERSFLEKLSEEQYRFLHIELRLMFPD